MSSQDPSANLRSILEPPTRMFEAQEELERILGTTCDDQIKTEDDLVPTPSRKELVTKLKEIATCVEKQLQNKAECLFLQDNQERPFLKVFSYKSDPFLVDRAALTINFFIDNHLKVVGKLLTFNRDVITEIEVDSNCNNINNIIECLIGNRYRACNGYREQDHPELLSRLKKSDLVTLTCERFNGNLIYRARTCNYAVEVDKNSSFDEKTCAECKKIYYGLNIKYPGAKSLPLPPSAGVAVATDKSNEIPTDEAATEADENQRRKRGRPKGSVKKVQFDIANESEPISSNVETNLDEKCQTAAADETGDNYETTLEMVDDPKDKNYQSVVRRGIRKRMTTKRQKALLELSKRKRGRPPSTVGPFHCEECPMKFELLKEYKKHMFEHTNLFGCDFEDCDRRFKSQKDLEIHTRKHRGEKPYVCNECDKAYQIRQDLMLHMRKHTGGKPYKCDLCPKTFARNQQRKIHRVVHTGERSFLCFECGTSFSCASTLTDHRKRKHLMQRNHRCQECQKGFFTRQELEAHARTHTGDKPFTCQDCGKRFSRSHHLKRHMNGVHQCEKSKNLSFVANKDELGVDDGALLGLGPSFDGETVFVTAEDSVLVGDLEDQMSDTEYIVSGRFSPPEPSSSGQTQLLIEKVEPNLTLSNQVQYLALSQDDEINLDQRTILLHQESSPSIVDISGPEDGGFVLITTDDNQQKLVPVAQFVSALQHH